MNLKELIKLPYKILLDEYSKPIIKEEFIINDKDLTKYCQDVNITKTTAIKQMGILYGSYYLDKNRHNQLKARWCLSLITGLKIQQLEIAVQTINDVSEGNKNSNADSAKI